MTTHWNSTLYDARHNYVTHYGEDVVSDWLKPQAGERILDLGCGTGHLTQKIADAGASVVGLDASAEMVAQARTNYPTLDFVTENGADFHFDQPFDAVFSNAALHWIHNADGVAASVYKALKPGGRFVAEFGCKGNVGVVLGAARDALQAAGLPAMARSPWYFPSLGEYTTLLEQHGFFVASALQFDRPTLVEGEDGGRSWLMMFGTPILQAIPTERQEAFLSDLEKRIRPKLYHDGQWWIDYRRLRIVATKPETGN